MLVPILALVLAGGAGGANAQDGASAEVRSDVTQLLDQGMDAFQRGDLDAAKQKFEQALLLKPTSLEAEKWVDKATVAQVMKAIRLAGPKNQSISTQLQALLKLSSLETRVRSRDAEQIAAGLKEYFTTEDLLDGERLLYSLVNRHGYYLMPGCIERLGAAEAELRTRAIRMVSKLDDDAVMPLCRVLHHPNATVVTNAIAALAKISNPAAIPSLMFLAQTTTDGIVKEKAQEAIRMLDLDGHLSGGSATDQLLAQASRFYMNSDYMHLAYHDAVLWSLEGTALVWKPVHDWALNEHRADQLIADALSIDPQGVEPNVLFACNSFAQYAEYLSTLEVYKEKAQKAEIEESKIAELEAERGTMNIVLHRACALTTDVLQGAVDRSMRDRRPEVSMVALVSIRESLTPGARVEQIPPALEAALGSDHRGVRFGAAECIAYMNPPAFPSAQIVVDNLADALIDAGARIALTIFPKEEDALHARELLYKSNVTAFNETSPFRGLQRALSFPPKDVIVLSPDISGEGLTTASLIAKFQTDPRTRTIPILIIADDGAFETAQATYANDAKRVRVVNRSIAWERLRDEVISALCPEDASARAQGIEIAARAARAILFVATRTSIFELLHAEDALVTVLENRSDSVRIPACEALGSLRTLRAAEALTRICKEENLSPELHVAALGALGDIHRGKDEVGSGVKEVLHAAFKHSDARVQKAASHAVGKIGASVKRAVLKGGE
ncbi:MAG: HEAT repeat domain-containing protein [Planctomycetes bacterium]|nr:HEAT repeat domain-containing protein [Planctomycetota bacterium]